MLKKMVLGKINRYMQKNKQKAHKKQINPKFEIPMTHFQKKEMALYSLHIKM